MKIRDFILITSILMIFGIKLSAANAPITTIGTVTSCPGSLVIVPITVQNFTSIGSITLRINYNPQVLSYSSFTSVFSGVLVGTTVINPTLARIDIAWSNYPGTTLSGIQTIFNLNFNYINGSTALVFDDSEGYCEYARWISVEPEVLNDSPTANYYINGSIGSNTLVTPTFAALGPYCVGATPGALVLTSTNNIPGTWNPSAISTASAGTYTYTFTPNAGQCATATTMNVVVNANVTPTFAALGPYCVGATPGALTGTSTNGITGTWSPAAISTASAGTITYTFTPTAGQCATTKTMNVVVNANVTPTFAALGPYCVGATPGVLVLTSTNSIPGTWNPSTISTASAGTNTYTFTPNAGQCATATTMNVVVNAKVTPTFAVLGPYCVGATPGALVLTSTNNIPGTWNPSTISTASAGTNTYTFTPNAGQCATTTTMDVVVNANVIPTFTALGPYCVGATPGALVLTSTNSIPGTWNPSTISTASAGTNTYTFTPNAGQCATTATMNVVVNANLTPTFSAMGPYCFGATPGVLELTSTNGITGIWNPANISTASAGTNTYTFTPTSGQCANTTTMDVVVYPKVTPTFAALGPYCVGATPGALVLTATNGITGIWNPASISTASAGTITYTFTPNAGECATITTMNVVVNANLTPTFSALGPYCFGATPDALELTSTNGITGIWNPANISTASAGTTTYTFTPNAGECATVTTMDVVVNAKVTPTFAALGPYCIGATPGALVLTSTNGITGIWNPASISTASAGTITYTFTPNAGECATVTTMDVVVNANVTPTFAALGPYCVGATPGVLVLTSTNSIPGTWNPSTISTASAGTNTYTFTPNAGQCATATTMDVVVNANVTPTFAALGPYCVGATPGVLVLTSTNSIPGTWNPSTISTASAGTNNYTFTPTAGQCATTTTMNVVVNANVTPTFAALGPYCVGATPGALVLTSTNGITGIWNPASISTASAGTITYTFTPNAGECATATSMDVVANTNVTPTFAALGPYCVGATPGALVLTSTNGITGIWNPASISTASAGTITYTFTPNAGECATITTMNVVVNANLTPTFSALGPYCFGATPDALELTSTNGITGIWNPANISTASAGTNTYTFTPTSGQCANTTTMDVVVYPKVTPTFAALGPYCVGATPGALVLTSTNGITGIWNPASISTASAGTITYTFTPNSGECATTTSMDVVVNANVMPNFAVLGPYCVGATPGALVLTSTNGITGIWNPASISTASAGTTTYTFTPTAGECATITTMNVVVNANLTPTFSALGPYCFGATPGALVLTSTNGITGIWNPANISTASAGTNTYTFTPNAGECATATSMDVSCIAVPLAGTITGSQSVAPNSTGLVYSIPTIPSATSYIWTVPTGFTVASGAGANSITVSATNSAVSGVVTVKGTNTSCGDGPESSLNVEVLKSLSVNVLLESLYNGSATLNKAQDATGDKYPGNVADQISIELHSPTNYATIIYSVNNVNLSTSGVATLTLPLTYSGTYYLTIKHRNSIEITSAAPVSFDSGSVSYSFDSPEKAFGGNLKLLASGEYGIFAGDVNQDGVVDAADLVSVDNAAAAFSTGYINNDVNGNGLVNDSDVVITGNNAAVFVAVKKP